MNICVDRGRKPQSAWGMDLVVMASMALCIKTHMEWHLSIQLDCAFRSVICTVFMIVESANCSTEVPQEFK